MTKYYVTMTDKFLSGWGEAEGKIAKYVYECDSYQEAEIVKDNAERRGDQKHVNIRGTRPHYSLDTHRTEWLTKADASIWYRPNAF